MKFSAGIYRVSIDAWLFGLLVGGYTLALTARFDRVSGIVVSVIALAAIVLYARAAQGRVRWILVWVAIAAIAIAPLVLAIYLRQITAPYQFIHDGALQTEAAIQFLYAGQNPYAEYYGATPLAQWWLPPPGDSVNPALYYFVYLPAIVIVSAPFFALAHATLGWFDERFVSLVLFAAMLWCLPRFAAASAKQRALVLCVGLNPLFVPFFAEGRNDIFVLAWLVFAVALLQAQREQWAVIALAVACAAKGTAWFILPFFAVYVLREEMRFRVPVHWGTLIRRAGPPLMIFALVFGALVLPFVLWNPAAFVEDIVFYPMGLTAHAYPIKSLGFGGLALAAGWIPNEYTVFPFGALQLVFGLPTLAGLMYLQIRRNTLAQMWVAYAGLGLVVGFFAHVFNDNHLGFFLSVFAIGVLTDHEVPRGSYDRY
jgi:hypothetical protein